MNILELAILKKMVGGGGGSGTDNYNDLSNLPKINDTTLSGNKTAASLGLQNEINSDNKLSSDLVDDTGATNLFVTEEEKLEWSGKQDEITNANKLDADLVDDEESTNKFVTAQEKETWNAKQNEIDSSHKLSSDLVDDTNHTNKFVTSQEKETWNGKQNAIDSDHKLSSSLVSFTTAEAAALASGIDSSKVGQISTNQTNILSVKQKVGVNLLHTNEFSGGGSDTGIDFTTENGIISVKGTKTIADSYRNIARDDFKVSSQYYVVATTTGSPRVSIRVFGYKNGSYTQLIDTAGTAAFSTGDYESFLTRVVVGGSVNDTVNASISAMIISKEDYDAGLTEFQQYGAPNYDLTRLEAEDRASLAEVVDSGAKNVWDFANAAFGRDAPTCTYTKTNTSITVLSSGGWSYVSYALPLKAGSYVLSGILSNVTIPTGSLPMIRVATSSNGDGALQTVDIGGDQNYELKFTAPSDATYYVIFGANWQNAAYSSGYTISNLMVCTKAAFDVSHKFVPYRVPITGLMSVVDKEVACSTTLTTTGIKFTATEKAAYRITATAIYYNSIPWKLAIKYKISSSSNQGTLCTVTHVDDEDVSLTVSGIRLLDVGGEFEIFAQYANSTNNRFYVLVEKIC